MALVVACVSTASSAALPVPVMSLLSTGLTFVGITTHVLIRPPVYAGPDDLSSSLSSLLGLVSVKAGRAADLLATALQIALIILQDLVLSLFYVVAINVALHVWIHS